MSWFRWHWQNLNEKKFGEKGSALKEGRAWIDLFRLSLTVEWGWRRSCLALECHTGRKYEDNEGLGFHISLFFPYLYLNIKHPFLSNLRETSTGFALWMDSWCLNLNLLFQEDFYGQRVSGWKKFIDLRDLLLGRINYSKEDLETFEVVVPLPEANYKGKATVSRNTWKRRRWFRKERIDTYVELENGLPFPGKGENSWDCGEDAIMWYGCSSTEYSKVVARGVELCMQDRVRYGSPDWRPSKEKLEQKESKCV